MFYLGLEVANAGGIYPTVINSGCGSGNFSSQNKIPYLKMFDIVKRALDDQEPISGIDLETIMEINYQTYKSSATNKVVRQTK